MPALLLIHIVSTLVMTGIIWFVQVVHYPLFARVAEAAFPAYESAHTARTTWVVAPPMLVEAATGAALFALWPDGADAGLLGVGLALLAVIWASTFTLQVPCHHRLAQGFDAELHRRLVTTNWIRTVAWTARAGLVCWVGWRTCR